MNKIMTTVNNFVEYLQGAKVELKKVTWPDRDDVTRYTVVVIIAVIMMSIFLWSVDTALGSLINSVMK